MRVIKSQGITLTELLVAVTMIGILMIGVASFAVAINRLQSATNRSIIVAMKVKAAMAEISQDALLAVGDATDLGVYSWSNNIDANSICFRQDLLNTPQDNSDDTWICYYHGDSFDISRCPGSTHSFPPNCTNYSQCCAGVPESNKTILLSISSSASEYAKVVYDANGKFKYIDLTLTARFDRNKPVHPINNPEHTLTTKVSPTGHSR